MSCNATPCYVKRYKAMRCRLTPCNILQLIWENWKVWQMLYRVNPKWKTRATKKGHVNWLPRGKLKSLNKRRRLFGGAFGPLRFPKCFNKVALFGKTEKFDKCCTGLTPKKRRARKFLFLCTCKKSYKNIKHEKSEKWKNERKKDDVRKKGRQ